MIRRIFGTALITCALGILIAIGGAMYEWRLPDWACWVTAISGMVAFVTGSTIKTNYGDDDEKI